MCPAPSFPRAARAVGRVPPHLNALQAAWLREMGIPRALLPAAAPVSDSRSAASMLAVERSVAAIETPLVDAVPAKLAIAAAPSPSGVVRRPQPEPERAPYVRVPGVIEKAPLVDLRAMVDECEGCGLSATRRHTVFGVGPERAAWMVVGEAPGEQEDLQGQPFVGKSGQLLTQMLRAVGVDRDADVFIANVIKCRPPGNRNPKPEEIAECRPFLMRQIEVVAPQRLLVLGRFAAQVLVGADANLSTLRGRMHTFTGSDGRQIPMIVSFHPAYLLRSPQEKAKAWRDLQLAARLVGPAQA